jgi:hypothetical protein
VSPTPLIELQRRLAEAGRIRMGEKSDKGAPKRLTTWRITSPTRELIEQAAGLYGGEPKPWESPTGTQYEVVTTTAELPVLVMPGYSFRQGYEFRTSPTLVERRCDGVEMDDGEPCICYAEGDDKCALLTRLTVALPELTTMLGWRLETKGDNAARELLASMDLVQGVASGRPFVPAKLRIVERRGNVNGQAVRYVVPVIDVSLRYAEILGRETPRERAELPAGYTPIAPGDGAGALLAVSLADGLAAAETQKVTRTSRSAAPIPAQDDLDFGGAPVPPDESGASPPPIASTPSDVNPSDAPEPPEKPLTLHTAKRKMDALVGQLRESGEITTIQLYSAMAKTRNVDVETMSGVIEGAWGTDGELHWGPLRDSLTLKEARELHARLARLWMNVGAAA